MTYAAGVERVSSGLCSASAEPRTAHSEGLTNAEADLTRRQEGALAEDRLSQGGIEAKPTRVDVAHVRTRADRFAHGDCIELCARCQLPPTALAEPRRVELTSLILVASRSSRSARRVR